MSRRGIRIAAASGIIFLGGVLASVAPLAINPSQPIHLEPARDPDPVGTSRDVYGLDWPYSVPMLTYYRGNFSAQVWNQFGCTGEGVDARGCSWEAGSCKLVAVSPAPNVAVLTDGRGNSVMVAWDGKQMKIAQSNSAGQSWSGKFVSRKRRAVSDLCQAVSTLALLVTLETLAFAMVRATGGLPSISAILAAGAFGLLILLMLGWLYSLTHPSRGPNEDVQPFPEILIPAVLIILGSLMLGVALLRTAWRLRRAI
jgi:hypothetical protein